MYPTVNHLAFEVSQAHSSKIFTKNNLRFLFVTQFNICYSLLRVYTSLDSSKVSDRYIFLSLLVRVEPLECFLLAGWLALTHI